MGQAAGHHSGLHRHHRLGARRAGLAGEGGLVVGVGGTGFRRGLGERGGRPRGFELRHAGEGWRIYSAPAYADVVGRFVLDGQSARLTQAALETLAVVAYRQPVTRGQVSAVRGVNVDGVMRTLTARGLVVEVGTEPTSGALLYGTTGYFLERMGLSSLDELPPLAPYLPEIDALEGVDDTGATIGGPS